MRTSKPLTGKEKRQLDSWNANRDRAMRRGYLVAGVLGFLGAAAMVWWLGRGGGTRSFDDLAFLRPVADAIGPMLTMMLFAGVLFAGGMLPVAWRIARAMQAQYQARYFAAGAECEPPRTAPPGPSVPPSVG